MALIVVPVDCKAASAMAASVVALADDPPASVICTLTEYEPSSAYELVPLIENPPFPVLVMTPAEVCPSPQVMRTVKSEADALALASVKVATTPENEPPSTVDTGLPLAVKGASAT